MRKNYYKSSAVKSQHRIRTRIFWGVKLLGGVAGLLAISYLLVFSHDLLTHQGFFKVRDIDIKGLKRLSAEDVLHQARIEEGINILSVNLKLVRKRLLANTWIAEAEVRREFPHDLKITIYEQEPLAVLDLGPKVLINTRGEIFKEKSSTDPAGLPVVTGLSYSDLDVPGKPRSQAFQAVMQVLSLGQQSGSILPNRQIKQIHVDHEMGVTLFAYRNIRQVRLGYRHFEEKYASLKNIMLHMKRQHRFRGFAAIDLNNINRIVAQPLEMPPAPLSGHKEA